MGARVVVFMVVLLSNTTSLRLDRLNERGGHRGKRAATVSYLPGTDTVQIRPIRIPEPVS